MGLNQMKVRILDCASTDWSSVLARCVHDVYQTPAWVVASRHCDGGTGLAIHITDEEHDLLIPLIKRDINEREWDVTSPYGYGGPVTDAGENLQFVEAAMNAAIAYLRDAGCVSWFIRLHPILNEHWKNSAGLIVNNGSTISINLAKTAEEHWRETMSGHRSDIEKARRAGVTTRLDKNFETMHRFIEIYRESMDRLNASEYYYFNDSYFSDLVSKLGERLLLLVAEEEGNVIGASMFTTSISSGIMQYHLSAAASAYRHRQPAKIILHAAREWGRESGYSRLHLGGGLGGAEDSLFRFKRGFSPDIHLFQTQRIVVDKERYAALSGQTVESLDLTGYFPAYAKK